MQSPPPPFPPPQAQRVEMAAQNLSFWSLPAQHLYAPDQSAVVADVLRGSADVGMVRTGFLETLAAAPGSTLSLAAFKFLSPRPAAAAPGFPFTVCTDLYPEWAFAALPHVPAATTAAVVAALLADAAARPQLSFIPPLSYLSLYVTQQSLGLIQDGVCLQGSVYDLVDCPQGTYKRHAPCNPAPNPAPDPAPDRTPGPTSNPTPCPIPPRTARAAVAGSSSGYSSGRIPPWR